MLKAIVPPALAATAHSLIVIFPADDTKADHPAPTPGVLTGETETVIAVVAPVTAVVLCTHVPAVVAVAKPALVAVMTCGILKNAPLLYEHCRVCVLELA